MKYSEVASWANEPLDNRGDAYEEFKEDRANRLIDCLALKFPNIRQCISNYWTSTPLSYQDYTATPEGTSYGILKNFNDPYSTMISAKSRIKNLYFTGQNLNMHGVLGVTVSAVTTCSEILGGDYLIKKVIQHKND
jgi:phytoene dehydrogenase-like protein